LHKSKKIKKNFQQNNKITPTTDGSTDVSVNSSSSIFISRSGSFNLGFFSSWS